jgi:hypothetical protein
MKLKIVLTAVFTFVFASAIFAQGDPAVSVKQNKTTNFSGKWDLDLSKSKLDERARNIESMTLTVSQTETELKIESSTKRAERENTGGQMRRGGGFGGDSQTIYTLDGKETVTDMAGATGGKMTAKATFEKDGRLKLEQTRNIETQMGARSMKLTETWSLSPDGKTLTVKREMETPRGTNSSELVFTKE